MVGFCHWHFPTFIITDISPPWWDFVMVGMCWVTTMMMTMTMMTMMFWLTGMSVGRLPRWSSEVQCSSPPLPVWAFHFKAVLKKNSLDYDFLRWLGSSFNIAVRIRVAPLPQHWSLWIIIMKPATNFNISTRLLRRKYFAQDAQGWFSSTLLHFLASLLSY